MYGYRYRYIWCIYIHISRLKTAARVKRSTLVFLAACRRRIFIKGCIAIYTHTHVYMYGYRYRYIWCMHIHISRLKDSGSCEALHARVFSGASTSYIYKRMFCDIYIYTYMDWYRYIGTDIYIYIIPAHGKRSTLLSSLARRCRREIYKYSNGLRYIHIHIYTCMDWCRYIGIRNISIYIFHTGSCEELHALVFGGASTS